MAKIDPKLFSAHKHALEGPVDPCPKCGAELVYQHRKGGSFISCSRHPGCDYTRSLHDDNARIEKLLPGTECPECGQQLILRSGRYGLFVGCSGFPECEHIERLDSPPEEVQVSCPSCHQGQIVRRQSRFGKTFYACNQYPKCKFALNYPPVAQRCQFCGFELLVKRKMASGEQLYCASKKCGKLQPEPEGSDE
ncbi:DNA topoisomerase family protein [Celerinatantimonas yamalensis]|uniref:Topoisomerase DNA-binding C4 zinc finger domain-containing protein n=1 Tax=Celerinatantimonas yamalensis TaxID=559956 RepID=A0ABW9GB48_9GAMM